VSYRAPPAAEWARAQPHPDWAAAREQGAVVPMASAPGSARPAFAVTRHEEAERVLRDPATFSSAIHRETSGRFKGETLVALDGEEHRRTRALVSHAFRPAALARWRSAAIEPILRELLDPLVPRGRAELVAEVTSRYPVQVICAVIGIPRADHARFLAWAERINLGPLDPEAGHAAAAALTDYLRPLVEARRERPSGDLLSELVHAEVEGERLSEERLFGFLRLLIPAGAETTYRAMGSCLLALLRQPGLCARVAERPELLPRAIDEALRWETPVAMVARVATRDVELGGQRIPAGSVVTVLLSSANRDERRYARADAFDLERPARTSLAFGMGPHRCLGISLAQLELEVGIRTLLGRLPGLRLDPGEPAPEIVGYAFRGPDRLPVLFRGDAPS
jgi:cytochrome P450